MVVIVLYQQLLTLRYISLRPEMTTLKKAERKRYYHLCGRAYSSMDPRYATRRRRRSARPPAASFRALAASPKPSAPHRCCRSNKTNDLYLSVIAGEFLTFVAVVFHPQMPWDGENDGGGGSGLQTVLPEFLVGSFNTVLLIVL
eukprot:198240-Prymnesium_polylepis.1